MASGEATLRQQIIALLRVRPWDAGGLSRALGISQRQVESHLTHVRKSMEAHGERLVREPAQCRDCGFAFQSARARPSRGVVHSASPNSSLRRYSRFGSVLTVEMRA